MENKVFFDFMDYRHTKNDSNSLQGGVLVDHKSGDFINFLF